MRRAYYIIKDYPDEALLEEVRRVAELVDKPVLTKGDFVKHSPVGAEALATRFGGWRIVLERAGLAHMHSGEPENLSRRRKHSDEEIFEEIRRVAELVDKPVLTQSEFKRHSEIGIDYLMLRLGGWRIVRELARAWPIRRSLETSVRMK